MIYFFSIISIAIALSMDTFSLSLTIGTIAAKKESMKLSIMVAIMHFIMPYLGDILGDNLVTFFALNSNRLLGSILLLLGLNVIVELTRKNENEVFHFSYLNMFLFSVGVSIDAFATGIGLSAISSNHLLMVTIFAIVSFIFTYIGLQLGKYASEKIGKNARIFGIILLCSLGIYYLCK